MKIKQLPPGLGIAGSFRAQLFRHGEKSTRGIARPGAAWHCPRAVRGENHSMDRRYRMPFFGVLDIAPREASSIILMQPIGERTQPGARFAWVHVFITHAHAWRPFVGDMRCHRLAHFGVSVELEDRERGQLALCVSAPDHTKARAAHPNGAPDRWAQSCAHSIIVHPKLHDMARAACEHFGFDPSASARRL